MSVSLTGWMDCDWGWKGGGGEQELVRGEDGIDFERVDCCGEEVLSGGEVVEILLWFVIDLTGIGLAYGKLELE